METAHTPGPWVWWYGHDTDIHDKPLRLINDETCMAVLDARICVNDILGDGQLCLYLQSSAADRALIAAAPDLLEVLKVCRDALRDHVQYDNGESLERDGYNAAIAALAKAKEGT